MRILCVLLLVLPLLFPGPCAEGVRRGWLGAPGAVPVLRGRRAADRLSCRPGALAPSRAPAAPRFRPAAGRSRARRARSDRRLPGRRGGMRLAAARGTAVRRGRPARGAVLLVRKSRLLHRACRCHAVRFDENRRAALRHTGRLRPADRYFCFPWNGERTNDTGISRTFRQQTVLRRILLGRASCGGGLARRHGLSRDLLSRAHAHGAGLFPRSGAAAAVRPTRADERSGCAFRVISPQKHTFVLVSFLLAFGGASVLMQMQAVASTDGLALPGLVRAKLLHGALAAALSAALCRAFPSCVPAFAPARPVSSPSAVSAGVLAAVTVLYIFYSGKKRDDTL